MPNKNLLNFPAPHSELAPQTPDEVYRSFYEKYGSVAVAGLEGSSAPLLEGRVVHFNNPENTSLHLMLFQAVERRVLSSRRHRYGLDGPVYTRINYDPSGYVAFATDGNAMQTWEPSDVWGLVAGRVDSISNSYRAEREELHLSFGIDIVQAYACIQVARTGENGTLTLPLRGIAGSTDPHRRLTGWILKPHESEPLRTAALQPASAEEEIAA